MAPRSHRSSRYENYDSLLKQRERVNLNLLWAVKETDIDIWVNLNYHLERLDRKLELLRSCSIDKGLHEIRKDVKKQRKCKRKLNL
jgi:hypothetical protein